VQVQQTRLVLALADVLRDSAAPLELTCDG
jgi:hypothetical protein